VIWRFPSTKNLSPTVILESIYKQMFHVITAIRGNKHQLGKRNRPNKKMSTVKPEKWDIPRGFEKLWYISRSPEGRVPVLGKDLLVLSSYQWLNLRFCKCRKWVVAKIVFSYLVECSKSFSIHTHTKFHW
jgi:hypothetical protein